VSMNAEQAETVALQALGWVLSDEDRTLMFMGMTGADLGSLRQRAGDADVLCSVMDFVLSDDRMVLEFAASAGLAADAVPMARYALPGGEQVHWT
jgi:hypothetical protein